MTDPDSENDSPQMSDAVEYVRRREVRNRLTEINLWVIAAVVVAGGLLFDLLSGAPPLEVLSVHYVELLLAVATFFFPSVFRLIFGALPLELVRRRRSQRLHKGPDRSFDWPEKDSNIREAEFRVLADSLTREELASSPATDLFAYYASSSRRLSESIYSRAGVYLLVGVVVAFSGLAFFYLQTAQALPSPLEGLDLLFALAPKFGILFFIELIAFFFLRQYRAIMDEFRYYEALKRNREETLALIRIVSDSGKTVDPVDLVKNQSFFSKAGVIEKDQSSELIESRKLEKNELDLLERIVDALSRSKR